MTAMRKVVERLQGENSSLNKSLAAAKTRKNGHTDKAALEEENGKLKVWVCFMQSASDNHTVHVYWESFVAEI